MSPATVLFGYFVILLLMGSPIAVALGVSAMITFIYVGTDLSSIVQIAFNSVNSFPIMALPAFVLAGALMDCAGISKRLVHIAETMVGKISGGLAITTTLSCVFFGAISGSGPATTAAVGMLMIPAMIKKGYNKGYAGAATASAGGIGIIIPPSIPMVIYGVTSQQSITKMFLAGVIPGLMIAMGLIIVHFLLCRGTNYSEDMEEFSLRRFLLAVKGGFWAILAPVIILGGIYSGIFTPTEAAIVAIFYTLFVGIFIYREITFAGLEKSLTTTSWLTGRVLIIMFTAFAFGRILVENRIPDLIAQQLLSITSDVHLLLILVVVFLLFLGMFMETLALILIVTPVLLPVMTILGVDPIHFGVILVACCGVGFSTPPLGENMFIASGIANVTLEEISWKALPFCAVTIGMIILMVFFPQTVLWLPTILGY
ncbi:TRAP dicarboxylate transporter, DctM subunit [Desulfonatronospira thiodismutans ASO3-1]|uniref:TRAP dicarboxylate transporter, DctM subunit n=1 Tax=Desulfonatronospira thiodismutans ASO3-1 TaxID=555779 RepID=D6SP30_9BACT|nr:MULTISPECIES: TRAP transporter large permease [Desulfonatronospira]EFI34506.1 TRAP dicarboxylate transporter, DctM subunit [Desulfonatronospira thiodismutans ASO3-1]RQD73369.1 MAG: TRAP transporter large permease [Desulfonatronospira sp. MSAO_Bac3]